VIFGRSEEEPPPQTRLGGATTTAASPAESEPESGGGPPEGLILLLFVIVTLATSAFVLMKEENHALHDPKAKAERGQINGLDDLSLLRERNFRRVLQKIRDSDRPLVASIRLSPGRADITTQNENGDQRILTFDPGFGTEERDFGSSTADTVPVQAIDPGAPQRMLQSVVEKSGRGAGAVDYVTTTFLIQRRPDWTIALKEGPARRRLWTADFRGNDVRLNGEPSAGVRRQTERQQRDLRALQRRLRLRTQCLSRATDAESASRCLRRFPP
jgi:hypothetical protein